MRKFQFSLKLILMLVLFFCLFDMPYWYYQFTRIICFLGFVLLVVIELSKEGMIIALPLIWGCGVLLFNVFIPITFSREIWTIIDITLVLVLFLRIVYPNNIGENFPIYNRWAGTVNHNPYWINKILCRNFGHNLLRVHSKEKPEDCYRCRKTFYVDEECEKLVNVLEAIQGFNVLGSCSGHSDRDKFRIHFETNSQEKLFRLCLHIYFENNNNPQFQIKILKHINRDALYYEISSRYKLDSFFIWLDVISSRIENDKYLMRNEN